MFNIEINESLKILINKIKKGDKKKIGELKDNFLQTWNWEYTDNILEILLIEKDEKVKSFFAFLFEKKASYTPRKGFIENSTFLILRTERTGTYRICSLRSLYMTV